MVFRAFQDGETTISAELDRIYYGGNSSGFTLIDDENNYSPVKIISEELMEDKKLYTLTTGELKINSNYTLADERFLKTPLQFRNIVNFENFDRIYYYSGDDLGSSYFPHKTEFRLWSPPAKRVILDLEGVGTIEMSRKDSGIFYTSIKGNLAGRTYQYLVNIRGEWRNANDPYAYSSTANNGKSVVINIKTLKQPLNRDKLPLLRHKTDAIIYELHVRDLSWSPTGGFKYRGKFLSLTEEGTKNPRGDSTGLDYITELGITHLQLLPIFDFGSVDEIDQNSHYNWGYDPVHYNIPEGSYSTDSSDPLCRIEELQKMIAVLHSKGIRVIMDVVYNHMFDRFTSDFEKTVPGYYFRTDEKGNPSNGSFCGNDIDSERLMVRKYILDSIKRWMTLYGMDGFRFDLMGILDIETMNQIEHLVRSIDPYAMVYGEGWNMPTFLPDKKKADMMNQKKMPYISHFNDYFRDTMKGSTMADNIKGKGLLTGDTSHIEKMADLLLGSQWDTHGNPLFSSPWKSINYVECHDNHTAMDKMIGAGVKEEELLCRQKMMLATVLFARGIPFIHAGQEMCRTKGGDHNSYRSSDAVNSIDWNRRSRFTQLVDYTREAIELRKETPAFRFDGYDKSTKIHIDKLKDLLQLSFSDGTVLAINLSSESHEIELAGQRVVFNKGGKTDLRENIYTMNGLEIIVIKDIERYE